jgi:hypothetical protein
MPVRTIPPIEPTVGVIVQRSGKPRHRVEYLLRARNIKPVRIAGNCRIFAEADVQRIIDELETIDAARQEAGAHA